MQGFSYICAMERKGLAFLCLAALLFSCTGKDPVQVGFVAPVIEDVQTVKGVDFSEVIITCRVSSMEGIKEYGVMFGEDELLAVPAENLSDNVFTVSIGGLAYSTTYHYQGYIGSGGARTFSAAGSWTTDDEIPPAPVIKKATPLPGEDAGTIVFTMAIPGWNDVVQKESVHLGICYSQENGEPTLTDLSAEASAVSEDGEAELRIENLATESSYYFRAYVRLGTQVSFSEPRIVNVPSAEDGEIVITLGASMQSITPTSAEFYGMVSIEWIPYVTSYGIEWDGWQNLPASGMDSDGMFFLEIGTDPGRTYSLRAYVVINDKAFYGETNSYTSPEIVPTEPDYVDLGLDVLWALRNVGADNYYDSGLYFAWGETENRRLSEDVEDYKWEWHGQMTKYNDEDGLTELESSDDAATVKWGSPWRTPSKKDWDDLLTYCDWTRISDNGRVLFKVTSKKVGFKDKCIYFPEDVSLMSSSRSTEDYDETEVWGIDLPIIGLLQCSRKDLFCVRPVRDKNSIQTNL